MCKNPQLGDLVRSSRSVQARVQGQVHVTCVTEHGGTRDRRRSRPEREPGGEQMGRDTCRNSRPCISPHSNVCTKLLALLGNKTSKEDVITCWLRQGTSTKRLSIRHSQCCYCTSLYVQPAGMEVKVGGFAGCVCTCTRTLQVPRRCIPVAGQCKLMCKVRGACAPSVRRAWCI